MRALIKPKSVNRRGFLLSCGVMTGAGMARANGAAGDPWSSSELIEPADLAKELGLDGQNLHIVCVTFPFLYRQKHIPHAQFTGPAR